MLSRFNLILSSDAKGLWKTAVGFVFFLLNKDQLLEEGHTTGTQGVPQKTKPTAFEKKEGKTKEGRREKAKK